MHVTSFSCVVLKAVSQCTDPNETAEDMIKIYKKECIAMRVQPVDKLLEQLGVGGYAPRSPMQFLKAHPQNQHIH